jgi:hypothetical protein
MVIEPDFGIRVFLEVEKGPAFLNGALKSEEVFLVLLEFVGRDNGCSVLEKVLDLVRCSYS